MLRRYDGFINNDEIIRIPDFIPPELPTDKVCVWNVEKYKHLSFLSYQYYSSPHFGYFIRCANQEFGIDEYEWSNNINIRIPYPLPAVLQIYNREREQYLKTINR